VHGFLWEFARFFAHLGGFGLLLLGILDSSFLFMPLGNDLLVVALTANHHERMLYYAGMASLGSVIGCFLTDLACRKGGEKGLENNLSGRTIEYVERKIKNHAGPALALACILPPPFPFTPFIIVMAALQYPRWKMLGIVAVGRVIRFSIEGGLAMVYGRRILEMAKNSVLQQVIIGLVVISIIGSTWSIYTWVRRGQMKQHRDAPQAG
jgi:membrane protein YqaA with SNARE-associated domain